MSWGVEWLALGDDADERAVKRAYARLLKTTRPEDDPASFQQLHAAYQDALAWVRDAPLSSLPPPLSGQQQDPLPEQYPLPDEIEAPFDAPALQIERRAPEVIPAPCTATDQPPAIPRVIRLAPLDPPEPAVDPPAACAEIIATARKLAPPEFAAWLEASPLLLSLQKNRQVELAVRQALVHEHTAVRPGNFDVLVSHFNWDDIASGIDPDLLAAARSGVMRHWIAATCDAEALSRLASEGQLLMTPQTAWRCLARLSGPWNPAQALRRSLLSDDHDLRRTLDILGIHSEHDLPPGWDPRHLHFLHNLHDITRINRWRLLINSLRGALSALAISAMIGCVSGVELLKGNPTGNTLDFIGVILITFVILGVLWVPVRWLLRQLTLPARFNVRSMLLTLIPPVMAIAAMLQIHAVGGTDARIFGTLLSAAALLLVTGRIWRDLSSTVGLRLRYLLFVLVAMCIAEFSTALVLVSWVLAVTRSWQQARVPRPGRTRTR